MSTNSKRTRRKAKAKAVAAFIDITTRGCVHQVCQKSQTIDQVCEIVAQNFQCTVDDLMTAKRFPGLTARQVCMTICNLALRIRQREIAKVFNRDRTIVSKAVTRYGLIVGEELKT